MQSALPKAMQEKPCREKTMASYVSNLKSNFQDQKKSNTASLLDPRDSGTAKPGRLLCPSRKGIRLIERTILSLRALCSVEHVESP